MTQTSSELTVLMSYHLIPSVFEIVVLVVRTLLEESIDCLNKEIELVVENIKRIPLPNYLATEEKEEIPILRRLHAQITV